jgi:hypothetical protein
MTAAAPTGVLQRCGDERRRAVTAASDHNGIDYLEVDPADQRTLRVRFLQPLPGEAGGVPGAASPLAAANLAVDGGVRVVGMSVVAVGAAGRDLTVTVDRAGAFSTYVLRLVTSATDGRTPPGFDPALAAVPFSFKAGCPTDADCRPPAGAAAPPAAPVPLDYLAKDYGGFLRLAYDRLAVTLPDWRDRNPADAQVALVEALAYVADQLSYHQDAVATEAYLTTARSRVSVRRHARLLDYRPRDGCAARAWITLEVEPGGAADGAALAAGTPVLSAGPGDPARLPTAGYEAALRDGPVVFETLAAVELRAARNRIAFHTWSDAECCLPAGTTRATLVDGGLGLARGDVLVLEEVRGPATGLDADADPAHRHPVRLLRATPGTDPVEGVAVVDVDWHAEDALPFPLQLSSRPDPGAPAVATAVARGNVALADHGRSLPPAGLGTAPDGARPWRPAVPVADLTHAVPLAGADLGRAAAAATTLDPAAAVAALRLSDGEDLWDPLPDLLGATGDGRFFVVELERDGGTRLRFGDGVNGARPPAGTRLTVVRARSGVGPAGNVGAGALGRVVTDLDGIRLVTNPLAAAGGAAPEDIEDTRRAAPVAFRTQQRAVTEADWVEVAQRHPEVQRAAARIRWAGSWYVVVVILDRAGGLPVAADPAFLAGMVAYLDRFRLAGYDLAVRDPVYVPIDLAVRACVDPDHVAGEVGPRLRRALGSAANPDGTLGLFHPDRLTFGQPVFVSSVHAAAMAVDGVAGVEVDRFQRVGGPPAGELRAGVLGVGDLEVPRLDDDPNAPEHGRLTLTVEGGR